MTDKGNVIFKSSPRTEVTSRDNALLTVSPSNKDILTQEFFASKLEKMEVLPWNEFVSTNGTTLLKRASPQSNVILF